MHPTWPQVLARRLGLQAMNLAQPGSHAPDLRNQARRLAGARLPPRSLVVIHTGGNDFIQKLGQVAFSGGAGNLEVLQPNPGAREAAFVKEHLEALYEKGARHFLVSGVPCFWPMPVFNMARPVVQGLVESGALRALGVEPGDPATLAMDVQAAGLNDRWETVCADFRKAHADVTCTFFDETSALHSLREPNEQLFDRTMWDMTMFHPSVRGHEQIAQEAHQALAEGDAVMR